MGMGSKQTTDSPSLIDLIERFPDPDSARLYLEGILWPDGANCPHCGVCGESTRLEGTAHRKGVWKCRVCRKQFTVTVGTIFEDSHIPLHKWVIAFHLLCASKKGISAHQIHRMLSIGYKSAWHMMHRIRCAMDNGTFDSPDGKLHGTVECDETFVGGKAKNVHNGAPVPKKTAVVALVERNGRSRARAVCDVNAATIAPILKRHVRKNARLMTDGAHVYDGAKGIVPKHESVNHEAKEYVRGDAHTNTVESWNSLLKRGIVGVYHHVSEIHLDRYLDEFCFRWDHRNVSDGERTTAALKQTEGKRLMYRECK